MELLLTDNEATKLIKLLKKFTKKYKLNNIMNSTKGQLLIKSTISNNEFILYYLNRLNDIHLNFSDAKTHYTLVRINIDSRFHKNSDGIVRGNRIEIFSEKEFKAKNDGKTHYKAYPLPFGSIKDTNDFFTALEEILDYTNTNNDFSLQTSLFD